MKVPAGRKREKEISGRKGERHDETEERERTTLLQTSLMQLGAAVRLADDDFGFIKARYVESLRRISPVMSVNNDYRDKRVRRSFRSVECGDHKRIRMRWDFRRAVISRMPSPVNSPAVAFTF